MIAIFSSLGFVYVVIFVLLFCGLAGRKDSDFRLAVFYIVFACSVLVGVDCRNGIGEFVYYSCG